MSTLFSRRRSRTRLAGAPAGFSLIELLLVLGFMMVLASMAGLQIGQEKSSLDADGATRVMLAQIRAARELAIAERRNFRVTFIDPSAIRITREEVPGPTTTVMSTVGMERGVTFALVSGLPDTPDAFGKAQAIDFGSASIIKFSPDGTLVDQSGNVVNGSLFLSQSGSPRSARAITVLGSTGRIRAFRWDGRAWNQV